LAWQFSEEVTLCFSLNVSMHWTFWLAMAWLIANLAPLLLTHAPKYLQLMVPLLLIPPITAASWVLSGT
jgi:hypothetical protein